VIQVVCQDVHGEGGHGDIHFVADVALLGTVGVQTPVGLLVPGEIGTGCVVLAALRACVPWLALGLGDPRLNRLLSGTTV